MNWDRWREGLRDLLGPLEFSGQADGFVAEAEYLAAMPLCLSKVVAKPHVVSAASASTSQRDYVRIVLPTSGQVALAQNGHSVLLSPHEYALYDAGKAIDFGAIGEDPFGYTMLSLDRDLVTSRVAQFDRFAGMKLPQNDPRSRVFLAFARELEALTSVAGAPDPRVFQAALAEALVSTLLLLGENHSENLVAVRQHAMQGLRARMRDPDLSIEQYAREAGIGVRTIQRAFQDFGQRPRAWLIDQRLSGVANDLRSQPLSKRPIADIAFSWGFGDIANFNRAFKEKYGVSPSKFRQSHSL